MSSETEDIVLSALDKLEEITEEEALDFLLDTVIKNLLGASPAKILVWLITPLIKAIFNQTVKPLLQLMYRNLHATVAVQSGRWTIAKIKQLEEEGNNEEIWTTIHTNY